MARRGVAVLQPFHEAGNGVIFATPAATGGCQCNANRSDDLPHADASSGIAPPGDAARGRLSMAKARSWKLSSSIPISTSAARTSGEQRVVTSTLRWRAYI